MIKRRLFHIMYMLADKVIDRGFLIVIMCVDVVRNCCAPSDIDPLGVSILAQHVITAVPLSSVWPTASCVLARL